MKSPALKINLLLIITAFAYTVSLYSGLPSRLPTHWNFQGQIDGYSPKFPFAFLLPCLMLLMVVAFCIFPQIDPQKNKYRLFQREWHLIQVGLVSFFLLLHIVTLAAATNPAIRVDTIVPIGIGLLYIFMGNYFGKIRQNWFLGIRTPWTLSNQQVWNKTHRFAGYTFVLSGFLILLLSLLTAPSILFLVILLAGAFLPVLYSYLVYRRISHDR